MVIQNNWINAEARLNEWVSPISTMEAAIRLIMK